MPNNLDKFNITEEALGVFINSPYNNYREHEVAWESESVIVGNGPSLEQATVKFMYDGSIWPIPEGVATTKVIKS